MADFTEKQRDLAMKLLALADRGFGGEQTTAQAKLEMFLLKHGITIEDLLSETTSKREFFILKKHNELFFTIVWHIKVNWYGKYQSSHKGQKIFLDLTTTEYTEITVLFDHYVIQYDEERRRMLTQFNKDFKTAFVQGAKLWTHESNLRDEVTVKPRRSWEDLIRIESLLTSLKIKTPYKRLNQ